MKSKTLFALWKSDRWVKPFFSRYKKVLLLALFLGVLTFVCASALMFVSGYLISAAAQVPESILLLNIPLILVRIFGIGKPFVHYAERLCSHDWVLRMTSDLRGKLYRCLEKDALFFHATQRTGDVLGLLAEDIGHIQNLYLRTIFPTVIAVVLWFVILVGAGFFSPFLACVLFIMIGCALVLVPLVSVLVCGARRIRYKSLRNELYAELTDNVLGVSDWVFSQRSEEYLTHYKHVERSAKELVFAEERFARQRTLVLQALFGAIAVVLLVWAAIHFGGQGDVAARWIAAFVLSFFPLIDAFAPLSKAALDMVSYQDSLKRLNGLPDEDAKTAAFAPGPTKPFDIRIEKVSYTYPHASCSVLNGLSLVVPEGQKIALLGRSGAGKSTLASLIHGDMTPDAGEVTLAGIPASAFGDEMSRFVGVIQQHTYLFHLTLLENIRIARAKATEDEVWDALEKVGLRALVERLPQGLHTMVDEAGVCFSGGERHRIALARVLLQDTPVVILDEPCVGLDPVCEHALLKTLFEVLDGRTVFMITHHLAGVSACDRVVFIENGRVSLDGTPDELKRTSKRYRQLLAFDCGQQEGSADVHRL